jgi:predicted RNA binding protein YcfA (HicA-like mRNA interferase family)
MPSFGPTKRKDLIKALKKAGFEGPFAGGKHEFLVKGNCGWFYQIHIKTRLVRTCLQGFSNRPISAVKIGRKYKTNGDIFP